MPVPLELTRRRLLSSLAAGFAAPLVVPASALGLDDRPPPSERISLGVIGCGGKGMDHIRSFLQYAEVELAAVCDVDRRHRRDRFDGRGAEYGREPAVEAVAAHAASRRKGAGEGCAAYVDFRELCGRDDLDAVVVATPDHWHALCNLAAIRAGKDVYGEKPFTHHFREGQQLVREIAERRAIFQTGSQQRSEGNFRRAAELARNGVLGAVQRVEVGLPVGYRDLPETTPETAPPENLDYDLWTGPAPLLPFARARLHRWWRGHTAYGGGTLMDWIGHHHDIAHWGLGTDDGGPLEVEAIDWTWPETSLYDTPVDFTIRATYPGGVEVSISSQHALGTKFIGDAGWVYVNRGRLEASDPRWTTAEFDPGSVRLLRSNDHRRNFLDSVRSREECLCPASVGHRSITPGHLAYVSQRLGRPVRWDAASETFPNDPEAERLLDFAYRPPWTLTGGPA